MAAAKISVESSSERRRCAGYFLEAALSAKIKPLTFNIEEELAGDFLTSLENHLENVLDCIPTHQIRDHQVTWCQASGKTKANNIKVTDEETRLLQ